MSDPILLKFSPGALRAERGHLDVSWQRPDGSVGAGPLSSFVQDSQRQAVGIVLSAADVQITSVELSRRQARHLQKVLPFLLEEQLIGDPETLWYASAGLHDGRYPVLVCDRVQLTSLVDELEQAGVNVVGAAVDAQLVASAAPILYSADGSTLLVQSADQVLCLPTEEVQTTCEALGLDIAEYEQLDESSIWDALRQGWKRRSELLHSELRPQGSNENQVFRLPAAWRQFAGLAASLLVVIWALAWTQAWQYSRLGEQTREQAADLYKSLFPGDRATAKLQGQFKNRLAQLGGGAAGGGSFLSLMTPVADALASMKSSGVAPKRLMFEERDGLLMLDLEAKDYEGLEALRGSLQSAGLSAEIANFRNQGDQVAARMKVAAQ